MSTSTASGTCGSSAKGGGMSWLRYWMTRNVVIDRVRTHGDTQVVDVITTGTGFDGIAYEYSVDNGTTYTEVKSASKKLNKTLLPQNTTIKWRARLYKGANYSPYCEVVLKATTWPEFTITVDTTKAGSAANTFILPTFGDTFDCYINWGDGGAEEHLVGVSYNISHTYSAGGVKQIKVRGTFPRIKFAGATDIAKVTRIDNWGNIIWGSVREMWEGCANMEAFYNDSPATWLCTDFYAMFRACSKFNGAVNDFDTSNNTSTVAFVTQCPLFNQPVNRLDMSKVTDIHAMFQDCIAFNQSVAGWDMRSVIYANRPLQNARSFNQPIDWNLQNAITMQSFVQECTAFNQAININCPNVTNLSNAFKSCSGFNSPVTLNCGSATTVANMFMDCLNFNALVTMDTHSVQDFSFMFSGCALFNQDINFDCSAATNMDSMLAYLNVFNGNVTLSNTGLVTNMNSMFINGKKFNKPVSLDTTSVTSMQSMFMGCGLLNSDITFTSTANVTNMSNMFNGCSTFNKPLAFNVSNVANFSRMFQQAYAFNQDLSAWNTSAATNMSWMFYYASAFKRSLATFNLANVTDISSMLNTANINTSGTTTNYDNTLISWAAQAVKPNLNFTATSCKYGDAGLAARNILTGTPNSWTITDGGHI